MCSATAPKYSQLHDYRAIDDACRASGQFKPKPKRVARASEIKVEMLGIEAKPAAEASARWWTCRYRVFGDDGEPVIELDYTFGPDQRVESVLGFPSPKGYSRQVRQDDRISNHWHVDDRPDTWSDEGK